MTKRNGCYWSDNPNGFVTGKVYSLNEPCVTIMKAGMGGDWLHHWWIQPGGGKVHDDNNKPLYSVPSMADIVSASSDNGPTVISTFAGCGGSSTGYRLAGFRVLYANEFDNHAVECYRLNKADYTVLDDRDIHAVTGQEILNAIGLREGELDVLDGSPPCFAADVPIVTARGIIPIEDVVVGDMVLTHKCRWRRILHLTSHIAETILVEKRIHVTPDHRFYSRSPSRKWRNEIRQYRRTLDDPKWLKVEQLQGSFCAVPVKCEQATIPSAPLGFTYSREFWLMIGRWIGDGWLRIEPGDPAKTVYDRPHQNKSPVPCLQCGKPSEPNRRIATAFTNYCSRYCATRHKQRRRKKPRYEVKWCSSYEEAGTLHEQLSLLGVAIGRSRQRTATRFTVSRKSLALWLKRWFREKADKKTMPGWVLSMPRDYRESLLKGYLAADGQSNSEIPQTATTVSRCLAVSVSLLAHSLGKTANIVGPYGGGKSNIEGREVNSRPMWFVNINEDDGRYTEIDDCVRWRKIRRKNKAGGFMRVYDLEVEEDHSFVADMFIVHNCQSFSTAGKRKMGDPRSTLFYEYARLVRELRPKCFVAENVSGLVKGVAKGYFKWILKELKACGYVVEARLLDAQWLGVPQRRQRIIFVGVRNDLGKSPAFPKPLKYNYSVREACPELSQVCQSVFHGTDQRRSGNSPCLTVHSCGGVGVARGQQWWCETDVTDPTCDETVRRRKFTIDELKRICGYPDDLQLSGSYAQQWARLGNSVPPAMMWRIAAVVRKTIVGVQKAGIPLPEDV